MSYPDCALEFYIDIHSVAGNSKSVTLKTTTGANVLMFLFVAVYNTSLNSARAYYST